MQVILHYFTCKMFTVYSDRIVLAWHNCIMFSGTQYFIICWRSLQTYENRIDLEMEEYATWYVQSVDIKIPVGAHTVQSAVEN